MQRGLVITFAASANKARERAALSLMLENELGGRKFSGASATGCALGEQRRGGERLAGGLAPQHMGMTQGRDQHFAADPGGVHTGAAHQQ